MRWLTVAVFVLAFGSRAYATKIPDSVWQTGTLQSISSSTYGGTVGVLNNGSGFVRPMLIGVMHYFIDGPEYTYEANMRLHGRHPKQLLVTVHGPIKFALVGHDFYIQDDEGKTQKLIFVMRELRQ